ncbi:MAG: fructosamine kinase family protein [Planctomycetota bacterium]
MLDSALASLLHCEVTIHASHPLGGGCISDVTSVELSLRRQNAPAERTAMVVKRQPAAKVPMFEAEADGLRALGAVESIRCPEVHAVGVVEDFSNLVKARITPERPGKDAFSQLGRRLAELHQATSGSVIGWHADNFLGSAIQPNASRGCWVDFLRKQRIGFQLKWAVTQHLVDRRLASDLERILDRMDELLEGRQDNTSLLHGDLWSGNYLLTHHGVVLIDPAVYRGCREAEWGMISWFGNCPSAFERGYLDAWPLPSGWQRRVAIYRLYHQLNHLNLFGGSYVETCRSAAASICGF